MKINKSWLFLVIVIILYIIAGIISPVVALESLLEFARIFSGVIPILFLVFGIMFLSNLLFTAKAITRHVGKGSGLMGWVFAIVGGILSSGPLYMWYPLLADLKEKGMKDSLIACFLYDRAIKIPFIPIMLLYFGLGFTVIVTILLLVFSVFVGILVEKITEVKE